MLLSKQTNVQHFKTSTCSLQIDASSCGCNQIYTFTGLKVPPTLVFPNCSRILVQFHSDSSGVSIGFGMNYSAVPVHGG